MLTQKLGNQFKKAAPKTRINAQSVNDITNIRERKAQSNGALQ